MTVDQAAELVAHMAVIKFFVGVMTLFVGIISVGVWLKW